MIIGNATHILAPLWHLVSTVNGVIGQLATKCVVVANRAGYAQSRPRLPAAIVVLLQRKGSATVMDVLRSVL